MESAGAWRLSDRIGLAICWFLGLLFCAIAAAIVIYMLVQGIKYVRPELLTTSPKVGFTQAETGGFLDPLIGTFLVGAIGIAIALPLGIAIAVWLSEFGRPFALARIVESTVEMIAGTPSIVLALFGTVIFSSTALAFLSRTSGSVVFGRSFFAAGFMLSLVALPLVVSATREGLQAIPQHVREASYAVGQDQGRNHAPDPAAGGAALGRHRRRCSASAGSSGTRRSSSSSSGRPRTSSRPARSCRSTTCRVPEAP